MRPRRIPFVVISITIALIWGVIETVALWRARSDRRSNAHLT